MRALKTYVLLLMSCGLAHAHPLFPVNIDEDERQQYTQALRQLQLCLSRIDQAEISTLQEQANAVASKMRYLCFSGKRDDAEAMRRDFYKEMEAIDTVKQVKACDDTIPERFEAYMSTPLDLSQFGEENDEHICDHEILPVDQFNRHSH